MTFAFVFPGQDSQSVDMPNAFADHPAVTATPARTSDTLGQDIGKLITEGPAEELNLTTNTQPVVLTAVVTVYRAWQTTGDPTPTVVAGHSLGEYSALVAAGVITFEDAVSLICFRAKAMQEAVSMDEGGMAAILDLSDNDVRAVCAEASVAGAVEAVSFNAPARVVITGAKAATEKTCGIAKVKGVKRALPLPMSASFHSSLLKPTPDRLREYLANMTVNAPVIPVINNTDVAVMNDPAATKDALVRQATSPVCWTETVQKMRGGGITRVVEYGLDKVLAGLVKRIDGEIIDGTVFDLASLEAMLGQLK